MLKLLKLANNMGLRKSFPQIQVQTRGLSSLKLISFQTNQQARRGCWPALADRKLNPGICKIQGIGGKTFYSTAESSNPTSNSNADSNANSNLKSSKVTVDNLDLNVWEDGEGEHVVLCLPGLFGTFETECLPIFEKMNKKMFSLVSWDPPGQGKSRPPKRSFDENPFIRDACLLGQIMEKLGHKSYSVFGGCHGGVTGYAMALEFKERVKNLVLWGTHAYIDKKFVEQSKDLWKCESWSEGRLKSLESIYGREYLEEMIADWLVAVERLHKDDNYTTFENRCTDVECPVLIIHGHGDQLVSIDHAQYYNMNMPKCMLHLLVEAGHDPHISHTAEVSGMAQAFFLNSNTYFFRDKSKA